MHSFTHSLCHSHVHPLCHSHLIYLHSSCHSIYTYKCISYSLRHSHLIYTYTCSLDSYEYMHSLLPMSLTRDFTLSYAPASLPGTCSGPQPKRLGRQEVRALAFTHTNAPLLSHSRALAFTHTHTHTHTHFPLFFCQARSGEATWLGLPWLMIECYMYTAVATAIQSQPLLAGESACALLAAALSCAPFLLGGYGGLGL
jgi:hypothetical protein